MFEKWADKLKEKKTQEIEFKPYDRVTAEPEPTPAEPPKAEPALTAAAQQGKVELKLVRPESYDEVSTIADYLLAGCTVVLNMELLDGKTALRMYDFLNGITYSVDGEIKQVANTTFVLTPHNVDVSDEEA